MHDLLGGAPAAGFDDPIGMLYACHSRIRKQLDTLARLVPHLPAHGADEAARQAVAGVMRYFDTAGRHHHADEEENVFPLLKALGGAPGARPEAKRAVETIARLEADHVAMEAAWQRLRERLAAIGEGRSAELPAAEVEAFRALYAHHIPREEEDVFAAARQLLSPDQCAALGQAMAARRGVKLG